MAVTAVVTDIQYRMSLALIRDLAQAGVRVVVCWREGSGAPLGFRSKYPAERVTLPAEGWLEALWRLCRRLQEEEGETPALLPVGAVTLAALAADRARFDPVCGLCIPTAEQLDLLNSKEQVSRLARTLGIPVPRAFSQGEETWEEFARRVPYPCVVKPLCGEKLGLTAADRYGIAAGPAELERWYSRFSRLAGEPPLVQEYLPGGGLGCSVLALDGEIQAVLCHRRIREYPVSGGPSACCESIDRPDLTELVRPIAAHLGLTGLAMFEFKEDGSGAPRLLEVNPRIWGTFPLTRVSGSGIPVLWCTLAWNQGNRGRQAPLPPAKKPRLCRMQFAASDLMSGLGYARRGQWGKALAACADTLSPAVRDGLWEWSDPGPGVLYYRSLLRKESR